MATIWAVILAAGIPSAVFGILIRELNKALDRRERAKEEKDEARLKNQKLIIRAVMASLSLGEATAEAVSKIPDAHVNGEMHEALTEAKQIQEEYRVFEHEMTIKAVS